MKKRRRQRPYRPQTACDRLYVRLEARHVALLTFLLEAEDHLALPTVVDRFAAVVRLLYSPDQAGRLEGFLADLTAMCPEARVCWRPGPTLPVASRPGPARMDPASDRPAAPPSPTGQPQARSCGVLEKI